MAISEAQLETWSKQGSIAQSRDTYATVKNVLESPRAPYISKTFDSFLQGSYANDTNVYRDSDVDVVMRLTSAFYHDVHLLPADQYEEFRRAHPGSADYGLPEFKTEVAAWLKKNFGDTVNPGSKAIFIPGNGSRRDCDVLPCAEFRHYYHFNHAADQRYAEGICFFLRDGTQIVNYPKLHAENCTAKHKATDGWYKPTVRIYKNMRNYMVERHMLDDGVAPSYYVEGLLWNVPAEKYGTNYDNTFANTFNYLVSADRTNFLCANGIHPLLRDHSHVSWPPANCETYLNALRGLWNNWS